MSGGLGAFVQSLQSTLQASQQRKVQARQLQLQDQQQQIQLADQFSDLEAGAAMAGVPYSQFIGSLPPQLQGIAKMFSGGQQPGGQPQGASPQQAAVPGAQPIPQAPPVGVGPGGAAAPTGAPGPTPPAVAPQPAAAAGGPTMPPSGPPTSPYEVRPTPPPQPQQPAPMQQQQQPGALPPPPPSVEQRQQAMAAKLQAMGYTNPRTIAKLMQKALPQIQDQFKSDMEIWNGRRAEQAETDRGVRQDKSLEASSERQERSIEAASERQDRSIAASDDRLSRREEDTDKRMDLRLSHQDLVQELTPDRLSLSNETKNMDTMRRVENIMARNMDVVRTQMPKGAGPTMAPLLDAWVQTGRTELGDKNVPGYAVALLTVADQYARVLTGGGRSNVDTRKTAQSLLNDALNKGQIDGVFKTMRADAENNIQESTGNVAEIRERMQSRVDDWEKTHGVSFSNLKPKSDTSQQPATGGGQKFEEGKVYQDANGNKAKYQNGQWVPQ